MGGETINETIVKELRGVGMTEDDLRLINDSLNRYPDCLLDIPYIRIILAGARFKRKSEKDIRTFHGEKNSIIENAVEHNLNGLKVNSALTRPDKLVNVLKSLDYVDSNLATLKVLSVGPRSESEIFSLISAGFSPANIRGLDLISYSPFVDLGDMHNMPYQNAAFDIVILGWVLA
ncbi:MAG: hypothetical protein JWQ35_1540, partial [Bacteriovoracaceae bacterium]|nr:hypothetical protein [Bacteriovoracaceae bacterium]